MAGKTVTRNVTINIGAAASGLLRGVSRATGALRGFGRQVGKVSKAGAAIGLGAAVGFAALARQSFNAIDRLAKLGANVNATAGEMQILALAANFGGTSVDTLTKAAQQVSRVLGQAKGGSKSAAKAFADLGLNIGKLSQLKTVDQLEAVFAALSKVGDQSRRDALGAVLLGRAWREAAPFIEDAAGTFGRARAALEGTGLALGDGAKKTEAFNDSVSELLAIGEALRLKVFAKFAETMKPTIDGMIEWTKRAIEAAGGGDKLASAISGRLVEAWQAVVAGFERFKVLWPDIRDGIETIAGLAIDSARGIASLVESLGGLDAITGFLGKARDVAGTALGAAGATAGALLEGNVAGAGRVQSEAFGDIADIISGDEAKEQTRILKEMNEAIRAGQVYVVAQ